MDDLVIMKNQQAVTTSLKVAEVFEKEHKHVMEAVRKLTAENSTVRKMFGEDSYLNSRNQSFPMFYMNRDGFTLLAMGFTGKKAMQFKLKYIQAFNRMEAQIKNGMQIKAEFRIPQTYGEALQLAADQAKQLEIQAPKVEYYESQMRNPGLMTVTEIAKDYGWTAKELNDYLKSKGIQYRQGKHWVLKRPYDKKGYGQYEGYAYNNSKGVHNNLKWTQKGKKFIYDLLAEHGILPVLEAQQINLF
ncbi:Rha family transcriptional regulator [Ligilactobacillus equi]|uniref:Phage-related antirepressor n=1 Tax=Ligilactobacillus equi DPC 6820 TaxID=1392007 RepID=V7HTE4_9LACO|nr:phage regulatory protein/antirepressor Ant [Ligilactobacillus equi]ETA73474.1 phage-related antirepressor [Ligilactobacillus equi DPC 6820]